MNSTFNLTGHKKLDPTNEYSFLDEVKKTLNTPLIKTTSLIFQSASLCYSVRQSLSSPVKTEPLLHLADAIQITSLGYQLLETATTEINNYTNYHPVNLTVNSIRTCVGVKNLISGDLKLKDSAKVVQSSAFTAAALLGQISVMTDDEKIVHLAQQAATVAFTTTIACGIQSVYQNRIQLIESLNKASSVIESFLPKANSIDDLNIK